MNIEVGETPEDCQKRKFDRRLREALAKEKCKGRLVWRSKRLGQVAKGEI